MKTIKEVLIGVTAMVILIVGVAFFVSSFAPKNINSAAKVNGELISLSEVKTAYLNYVPNDPTMTQTDIMKDVLNNIINTKLMIQDAKKKGITVTQGDIDTKIQSILQQNNLTYDALMTYIQNSSLTKEQYYSNLRKDILMQKLFEKVLKKTDVTKEEIKETYQRNINQLQAPEYVIVNELFISDNRPDEELVELTNTIISELQKKPFCDVVYQYSEKNNDCVNITVNRGTKFTEYENAAFDQKEGNINVVQNEEGIYFIKTLEKLNYAPIPLENISQVLSQKIMARKKNQMITEYIQSLREEAKIKILI